MWSTEALISLPAAAQVCKDPIDAAYDAWKEADASVRSLQRDVSRAWTRYDCGFGAPPARERLLELASRRHAAAEKLAEAIALLHQAGHIQPAASCSTRRVAQRPAVMAQQVAA